MVTAGAREAEINLTLLMWGLELSIKPDAFGARRAVVKLTFADQPEGTRHWWFINEDGRAAVRPEA